MNSSRDRAQTIPNPYIRPCVSTAEALAGLRVDRRMAQRERRERSETREGEERWRKLLLTPEEAARALSISRSKLYELIARGQLHSVRIGTSRRIPVSALVEFVEALTKEEEAATSPGIEELTSSGAGSGSW